MAPRSCKHPLTTNIRCPHCGRAHYDPGKRTVVNRWGTGTKVRILAGEHKGKRASVTRVASSCIFVRIDIGTKRNPVTEEWAMPPATVRRISGPYAHFP